MQHRSSSSSTTTTTTTTIPRFFGTQSAFHQAILTKAVSEATFAIIHDDDVVARTRFETLTDGRTAWLSVLPERSLHTLEENIVQALDGDPECANGSECIGASVCGLISGSDQKEVKFIPWMDSDTLKRWHLSLKPTRGAAGGGHGDAKTEEPRQVWPSMSCVLCVLFAAQRLASLIQHYGKSNVVEVPKFVCFQLFRPVGFAESCVIAADPKQAWIGFDKIVALSTLRCRFYQDPATGGRLRISMQAQKKPREEADCKAVAQRIVLEPFLM
jgi:hypothetical protein